MMEETLTPVGQSKRITVVERLSEVANLTRDILTQLNGGGVNAGQPTTPASDVVDAIGHQLADVKEDLLTIRRIVGQIVPSADGPTFGTPRL